MFLCMYLYAKEEELMEVKFFLTTAELSCFEK